MDLWVKLFQSEFVMGGYSTSTFLQLISLRITGKKIIRNFEIFSQAG